MSRFTPPSADEQFYVRALGVLTRPGRLVRTVALVANTTFYLAVTGFLGFVGEQVWDRSQAPFAYLREWTDPRQVVAGGNVKVWVQIIRHKRCSYAITWSVEDANHMVAYFGPVYQQAPGEPSPLPQAPYGVEYRTPPSMAPGPATIRVSLRGECPGNWIDNWWPVEVNMPPVAFEVSAAPPHDAAPAPRP